MVAITIEITQRVAARTSGLAGGLQPETLNEDMKAWVHGRIRLWNILTGTTEWEKAKEALSFIAWPEKAPGEELAAAVWENAVG